MSSAPVTPGVEVAILSAWPVNDRAPLPASPALKLNCSLPMVWLMAAVTDWPRARKVIASPAATATRMIVAVLRRFRRSTLRTPIRTLPGTPVADSRPLRATRRSSRPEPKPKVAGPARVSATGLRSARRRAGSDAAAASAGPGTRLATTALLVNCRRLALERDRDRAGEARGLGLVQHGGGDC